MMRMRQNTASGNAALHPLPSLVGLEQSSSIKWNKVVVLNETMH